MTTLAKTPTRNSRNNSSLSNPWNRIFRDDFINFWNDDVGTIPAINIAEDKDQYRIEVAAPGLRKEDFDLHIDIERNMMTISCEDESDTGEDNEKNDGYSRREYNYSSFSRSFTLPEYGDTNRISAKYNDGILNVTIPKKPETSRSKSQKILVQ